MTLPRLRLTALDCPNALELGYFYEKLTGGTLEPLGDLLPEEVTWIELDTGHGTLAFQQIDDFVSPHLARGRQAPATALGISRP